MLVYTFNEIGFLVLIRLLSAGTWRWLLPRYRELSGECFIIKLDLFSFQPGHCGQVDFTLVRTLVAVFVSVVEIVHWLLGRRFLNSGFGCLLDVAR